jgi:hypothetical protein
MDTHAVSTTVTRGNTVLDSVVGYIISHRHSRDRSCDTAFNLSMVGRKAFSVCSVGAWALLVIQSTGLLLALSSYK